MILLGIRKHITARIRGQDQRSAAGKAAAIQAGRPRTTKPRPRTGFWPIKNEIAYALAIFPLLMQLVQTRRLLLAPLTSAFTFWRFTFQRRRVTLCACEMLLPNCGPLPQTSHTCAIALLQILSVSCFRCPRFRRSHHLSQSESRQERPERGSCFHSQGSARAKAHISCSLPNFQYTRNRPPGQIQARGPT